MAKDTTEVLLGPGELYVAPVAAGVPEARPTNPTTAIAGNWDSVGYTEDGVNIVADLEYSFFTPAEEPDPIATLKDSQEVHFRCVAAQFSLTQLQRALGGGTITPNTPAAGFTRYTPPATTGYDSFSLLFRTKAPGTAKTRDVYVPHAISMSSVDVPHTKGANPSVVALDFRAIKVSGTDIFDVTDED